MPNAIELAKQFVPILDEVYQNASLTSDLDGAAELARQGANANELTVAPKAPRHERSTYEVPNLEQD